VTFQHWRVRYECPRGHKWFRALVTERWELPPAGEAQCPFCGAVTRNRDTYRHNGCQRGPLNRVQFAKEAA